MKLINMKQQKLFENTSPYVYEYDYQRLRTGRLKVWHYMKNNEWATLREISEATYVPEASASACLRDFRKEEYGSHIVNRRIRGKRTGGLWEYQLIENINNED